MALDSQKEKNILFQVGFAAAAKQNHLLFVDCGTL